MHDEWKKYDKAPGPARKAPPPDDPEYEAAEDIIILTTLI